MTITGPPAVEPEPALGFGQLADFDKILPACAAMFEEEVGLLARTSAAGSTTAAGSRA